MTLKPLRFPADRTSRTKKDPGRLLEQARFIYICREGIEGRQGEGRHREEYIYIFGRDELARMVHLALNIRLDTDFRT